MLSLLKVPSTGDPSSGADPGGTGAAAAAAAVAVTARAAGPADVDWRSAGRVTPAKRQGKCAACWAFAAAAVLESQALIQVGPTSLASSAGQDALCCCKRATCRLVSASLACLLTVQARRGLPGVAFAAAGEQDVC